MGGALLALLPAVLFDGTGFATDRAVVIDGDRIVSIVAVDALGPEIERLELDGTLTPGLVDGDVDLLAYSQPMRRDVWRTSWGRFAEEGLSGMVSNRESAVSVGVTTVVNLATPTGTLGNLREKIASGRLGGPRIEGSGPLITGGPTDDLVGQHDVIEQGLLQIASTADAALAVGRVADTGWTVVLVDLGLEPALVAAVVGEAHARGLEVVARVDGADQARAALALGIDGLHGAFVADRELVSELVRTHASWTPNLTVATALGTDLGEVLPSVARAQAAGVPIRAGSGFPRSDGPRMGDDLYAELGWIEASGIAPGAVIEAATRPLVPGAPADLVWFAADLREGAPAPEAVAQVWKDGVAQLQDGRLGPEARRGFRRTNVLPQGYFYWEPVLTGVFGAGLTAFDVANTGAVAVVDVQYSLLNQVGVELNLTSPSFVPRTDLSWRLHYDGFDALWYGRGNDTRDTDAVRYNDTLVQAEVRGDTELGRGLSWTTGYTLAWTQLRAVEALPDHPGAEGGWLNSLDLAAQWDHRDNRSEPWRGTFVRAGVGLSDPILGATVHSVRPELELRQYVRLVDWHVLAFRLRWQQALGREVPFQQLPEFGGSVGRGFNPDRFLGALGLLGQAEYRGQVYRALHVAAFVDVGTVAPGWDALTAPHVAVGAGPRVRFNSEATLAWDIGFGLGQGGVESFNILFRMGNAY